MFWIPYYIIQKWNGGKRTIDINILVEYILLNIYSWFFSYASLEIKFVCFWNKRKYLSVGLWWLTVTYDELHRKLGSRIYPSGAITNTHLVARCVCGPIVVFGNQPTLNQRASQKKWSAHDCMYARWTHACDISFYDRCPSFLWLRVRSRPRDGNTYTYINVLLS